MTDRPDPVGDRVRAALHAEGDAVTPDADSLPAIRRRVRTVRRRRRAVALVGTAAAVVAVAIAVPLTRDDDGRDVTTGSDRTTSTSAPSPTAVEGALDAAVWPDPTGGELFDAPEGAVASFAAVLLGVDDPPLSAVRSVDDGSVEVDLMDRSETGAPRDTVATTVAVDRLDGAHWFVTGARSADVRVDTPAPGAVPSDIVRVAGEGRGFEGTIVATLRARTAAAPVLAEQVTVAGTTAPAPFALDLPVPAGGTGTAVLVVSDASGADNAVPHATVLPVLLPPPGPTPPSPAPPAPPEEVAFELGSQPLWPFRTFAEAEAWRSGGATDPIGADAAATASAFTTDFLGFAEIDEITSQDVRADEAWIGVGYTVEGGATPATSAVVHLVRFGPHADSPWEVVGTRDSVLTLETPAYGTAVGSPATVGGTITGVDEAVRVQVRQPSTPTALGESCCTPAGGEGTPWAATVSWTGATDPAVTIVASTGGHVQEVEIFAVTGIARG